MSTIEDRLWGRTERTESGCWEFAGARARTNGYGRISYRGAVTGAHRLAYELAHGAIPEGMHVLHSCDNPPCVNPEHLSLGTHRDNMMEMLTRGRQHRPPRGQAHPQAKLSDQDIADIRAARAAGERYQQIADRYGIHYHSAWKVATGYRRTG